MLTEHDKKDFANIIKGAGEIYGKEPTQNVMRMFWAALLPYDIAQIEAAFTMHVKTSRFMPTIAEVIDRIESLNPASQRLNADEAWAKCPKSEDESAIMTEEMLGAWSIVAKLYEEEGPIPARRAFVDAYNRLCEESRAMSKPVRYVISQGWDKAKLSAVIQEGLRLGHITQQDASPYLLQLESYEPAPSNIAGLLANPKAGVSKDERARILDNLAKLKGKLHHAQPVVDTDQIRREVEEADRKLMEAGA